jgi:hypothetical protein
MKRSKLLLTPDVARRLLERLNPIGRVSQFDSPGEPQAETLVHSLTDLEKSFREILDVLLPKLLSESLDSDEINDVLLDIGEELRHVLYHIRDPKYFSHVIEDERDTSGT